MIEWLLLGAFVALAIIVFRQGIMLNKLKDSYSRQDRKSNHPGIHFRARVFGAMDKEAHMRAMVRKELRQLKHRVRVLYTERKNAGGRAQIKNIAERIHKGDLGVPAVSPNVKWSDVQPPIRPGRLL